MSKINTNIERLIEKAAEEQDRIIGLLAEEINKQRLVVFAGAGCSMSVGLPSWSNLIEKLVEDSKIKSKERDIFRLASRLERELGPLKFREKIAGSLRIDVVGESALLDALITLETYLFVTTNYDTILEDYFRQKGISPSIVSNARDIPSIDPTRKTIVKLHGDLNSPTSMVITAQDYSKYKKEGKAYIDWLESIAAQKSILFVGASFDDPRLKDVDDYVLNIFGSGRRQPFIFFKIPEPAAGDFDEDFETEIADFEALCDDFRDRGFYLILVRKFEEVANILNQVNKKVRENKLTANPGDVDVQLRLKEDYSRQLETKMEELIDHRIRELKEKTLGKDKLPGMGKVRKEAGEMIDFLDNAPHDLGVESRLDGLLCVTDALLILAEKKDDIIKARHYYEKANEVFQKMDKTSGFQERLRRIRAKLLFEEGRVDESLDSIAKSQDPKTISFWLLLMVEAGKVDEAYEFVERNTEEIQWIAEKLRIYVLKGKISEAERLYWNVMNDFDAEKEKGDIENSKYKEDSFFDNICFAMIHSIYFKAFQLTGKKDLKKIEFIDFPDKAKDLLRKSLEFVDRFSEKKQGANPEDDYRLLQTLLFEMSICRILGNFERADNAANKLLMVNPLERQVVGYIIGRGKRFPGRTSALKTILKKLDKQDVKQFWSCMAIADVQEELGDIESSLNALKKAIAVTDIEGDKNISILMILSLGIRLEKLDEIFSIVKNSFQLTTDEAGFFEGFYNWASGKPKDAIKIINQISELSLPHELKAMIRLIKARGEIENQKWMEAKKLLEDSLKLQPDVESFKTLLFVLTKLQDEVEILRVAEKFETLGIDDDKVTRIKAQAARNLHQFEKSVASWRKLKDNDPGNPEYAFELAQVLILQVKEKEAVEILEPFVQPDEKLDLNCLHLAVQVYTSLEEREKAFSMLNECYDKIQEHPGLLFAHWELGSSIGEEEKTHESFERLMILDEKGEHAGKIFIKYEGMEQIVDLIKKKRGRNEKLIDSYRKGEISRLFLCDLTGNNSLYLDWAIRTQSLAEDFLTPEDRKEFTIYSTNSFRTIRKENVNLFGRIEAPKGAEKIVIDYHALITIHRLGLVDKLCRRYNKIAYPEIFTRLWKMEQLRYAPHQLSRMEIAKKLINKLDKNEIKAAEAPVKDSRSDRSLSLARIEKCPLVDNYIKEEELGKYPDVSVIRLPQLLDWMYEKSRLSENEWEKTKKYSKGEPSIGEKNRAELLDKSMRIVIDQITLELMEELDLNRKLIDMGVALFIEKDIALKIRFEIKSFEFIKDVAGWHKELFKEISENPKFVEVQPDYSKEKDELKFINESLYLEAAYAPVKYCQEKNGFLLTDDRWTQVVSPSHFGTDALLKELFERKIIDIAEYTTAFLTLCKWRYRFLLPDIRVLVFLAKQYKKKLPGRDLELVASYLRKNMEDSGLSFILEPTSPPVPIAYKYYLSVIDVWLRFLAEIWQDDETFGENNLLEITDWFYLVAMPAFPEGIPDGTKTQLYRNLNDSLSLSLFAILFDSVAHKKLHKFFRKSFERIFSSDEEKESALIRFIRFVKNLESPKDGSIKDEHTKQLVKNSFIVKGLETFFGKEWTELPSEIEKHPKLVEEVAGIISLEYQPNPKEVENILKALNDFSQTREEISEYRISPLITIKRTPKGEIVAPPHELIKHPDIEIKKQALYFILNSDFITDLTKRKIEELKERLVSSSVTFRQSASEEAVKLLLKDFQYGKSLIEDFKQKSFSEWPRDVFNAVWRPDLSTVMFDSRLLFNEKLNIEDISGQIRAVMNRTSGLAGFLDWILEECFFVPLGPPLNPWRFVKEYIKREKISKKSALSLLIRWIQENNDPLAYLIALEVVLNLRVGAEKSEINEFKSERFFGFLNKLFEALLLEGSEDAAMDKHLFDNIRERWLFRTTFNQYYLKYIDLNCNESMEDDYKVMLAWWMAREFEKVLLGNFSRLSVEVQTLWLKENIRLIQAETPFDFEHFIKYRKKELSVLRYYTLVKAPTLTALTLAIINPSKDDDNTFKGLKKPTTALHPKFTNAILNALPEETLFGEEHIPSVQYHKFQFLWQSPFCISAPHFLREYYDDAFELLGEKKVEIVKFAEAISGPDFLKNNLPDLSQMEDAKKRVYAPFLLSSLDAYVQLHGKMPFEASVFKENKTLIKDIILINDAFSGFCFQKAISILSRMISVGNSEWTDIFRNQLESLDYGELISKSELMQALIQEHIYTVVVLGGDLSILYPIIQKKTTDNALREVLGKVKTGLASSITRIPIENRENIRKFLNQIADVPAILAENHV